MTDASRRDKISQCDMESSIVELCVCDMNPVEEPVRRTGSECRATSISVCEILDE